MLSELWLNENGQVLSKTSILEQGEPIRPEDLYDFFRRELNPPLGTTDIFVWVHGWRTNYEQSHQAATSLFQSVQDFPSVYPERYAGLTGFQPWFIAIHWPSNGWYYKIRQRTADMIEKGEAEYFLASLLGFLKPTGPRTLQTVSGANLHCLGHSFGGRFLTAAIGAAHEPSPGTRQILDATAGPNVLSPIRQTQFDFNVDSMVVFQMAAPCRSYHTYLDALVSGERALCGPIVCTYSRYDVATGFMHRMAEFGEAAIGYCGVQKSTGWLRTLLMREPTSTYENGSFDSPIINVNAAKVFRRGSWFAGGAHSDIFHPESAHLILSVVQAIHSHPR